MYYLFIFSCLCNLIDIIIIIAVYISNIYGDYMYYVDCYGYIVQTDSYFANDGIVIAGWDAPLTDRYLFFVTSIDTFWKQANSLNHDHYDQSCIVHTVDNPLQPYLFVK